MTKFFSVTREMNFQVYLLYIRAIVWSLVTAVIVSIHLLFAYVKTRGGLPIPSLAHRLMTKWIGALTLGNTIPASKYYAIDQLHLGLNLITYE